MQGQYTAIYQKRERWYVGYVKEVPGANTQGRTLAETRRNLREALILVLECNRDLLTAGQGKGEVIEEPIVVEIPGSYPGRARGVPYPNG